MKFIQRNFPFLVGWLVYFALKTAFNTALYYALYYLFQYFFLTPSNLTAWILVIISSTLSGFLGFLISAKWITQPLSKHYREAEALTVKSLLVEWIFLGFSVLLYGRLPVIALGVFLYQSDIGDLIADVWIYLVSFLAYREILSRPTPPFIEALEGKSDSSVKVTQ